MSDANQHSSSTSFFASPKEALKARPEEFLYLACLHEGTGVEAPDFLAVVDAEAGRGQQAAIGQHERLLASGQSVKFMDDLAEQGKGWTVRKTA